MKDHSNRRQDIQALRGIAVLLVLLFHAKIGGLAAGYLGVDIFFVLSGYLITGLVHRRLVEGRFSFASFYLDRAKRLLPAALVVYASTTVAAYWLLTDPEFDRLLTTLWGALSFTANMVLWTSTDYFTPGAKFNAFLHVWSLSLEEQFYFLLPLALFLTPTRFRLALLVVGGAASLALCLYLTPRSPVAAFYLLPTRAWEFAFGGVLALAEAGRHARSAVSRESSIFSFGLGAAALAILLLTPTFEPGALLGWGHPGLDAILVCLATGVLLILRFTLLERGPIGRGIARLGDVSYSLYLVHWPLFAFAVNAYLGEIAPFEVRAALLLVSVFLAVLLFRFIEEPFRRRSYPKFKLRPALAAVAASVMVAVLAVGVRHVRSTEYVGLPERSANHGLSARCDFEGRFELSSECVSGKSPDMLLWGDSFAMHLEAGLATLRQAGFVQATKSACAPIVGLVPYRLMIGWSESWARGCLAFNDSVMSFLGATPGIKFIILSSPFSQLVEDDALGLVDGPGGAIERRIERRDVIKHFRTTIEQLRGLGKEPIIVGPTPASGFDIGLCYERKALGLATFGPNRDCQLSAAEARSFRARVDSVLNEVSATTGVRLINLADYLCDDVFCRTEIDGVPLYWDAAHLSALGSRKVMAATGAGAAILADTQ